MIIMQLGVTMGLVFKTGIFNKTSLFQRTLYEEHFLVFCALTYKMYVFKCIMAANNQLFLLLFQTAIFTKKNWMLQASMPHTVKHWENKFYSLILKNTFNVEHKRLLYMAPNFNGQKNAF